MNQIVIILLSCTGQTKYLHKRLQKNIHNENNHSTYLSKHAIKNNHIYLLINGKLY